MVGRVAWCPAPWCAVCDVLSLRLAAAPADAGLGHRRLRVAGLVPVHAESSLARPFGAASCDLADWGILPDKSPACRCPQSSCALPAIPRCAAICVQRRTVISIWAIMLWRCLPGICLAVLDRKRDLVRPCLGETPADFPPTMLCRPLLSHLTASPFRAHDRKGILSCRIVAVWDVMRCGGQ